MKYFKLDITKTSKSRNGKIYYGVYDSIGEDFKTLPEVKEYLNENYGKCKREKTYIDDNKGYAHLSGYVYSYIERDSETGKEYIEQHWINLYSISSKLLNF